MEVINNEYRDLITLLHKTVNISEARERYFKKELIFLNDVNHDFKLFLTEFRISSKCALAPLPITITKNQTSAVIKLDIAVR